MTEKIERKLIPGVYGETLKAEYYILSDFSDEYKLTMYSVGIFMPDTGADERIKDMTSDKNTAYAFYDTLVRNGVTAATLKDVAENFIT